MDINPNINYKIPSSIVPNTLKMPSKGKFLLKSEGSFVVLQIEISPAIGI